MELVRFIIGFIFIISIAFLFSSDRRNINWRLVLSGIILQLVFAILITNVPFVESIFSSISKFFVLLIGFSKEGTLFLFPDASFNGFAFSALPVVILFSSISAFLYYMGVLQVIVRSIAWVMSKTMKLSGAESLSAAGNIFLGQTEAPLLVKPYIKNMSKSELMCLMTGGMATIAGGVFAAYVALLGGSDVDQSLKFATILLTASIMNAPAGIVMSKIFQPENKENSINKNLDLSNEDLGSNAIHALAKGASDGLKLALNIAAMLLAFLAVVYMLNYFLEFFGDITTINQWIKSSSGGQFNKLSMEFLLGQIFRLFAFMIGINWNETVLVGSLLGQKFVLNEFIAYVNLAEMKASGLLSEKSILISTYALCGFANFSSIAIQIGGIGSMAPSRQKDISKLGLRALLAATLATLLTGNIAGFIIA
ncbi:MAG: nucleoside transporter C-terminal domain-containing protein [Bacteroidota bacterium]|jgi:CNT family concentrative nucleoside transporter|nr:NupC/NupG family nucleoside CNT transporter [Flammeovirgaceae bacterium]MEC8221451.1 nucleoside transporter C-terminal domain-containing protein [Bacteroidota bacterium]|tara:strand:+ start:413 stop:1684 length:1272 start_codon:yes stop_codon:yes gene_type:complete